MVNEYVNTGFELKMQLEDIQLMKTMNLENIENKPNYKRTKTRTQKLLPKNNTQYLRKIVIISDILTASNVNATSSHHHLPNSTTRPLLNNVRDFQVLSNGKPAVISELVYLHASSRVTLDLVANHSVNDEVILPDKQVGCPLGHPCLLFAHA